MQRTDKIYQAALTCLTLCDDSPAPRSIAALFLDRLCRDPDWRKEEVGEVRRLIEAGLPELTEDAAKEFYEPAND